MTITTYPTVPLPAGAKPDLWQGGSATAMPWRVIHGVTCGLASRDDVVVGTTAIQFGDGRIDDGLMEPPSVYIEMDGKRPGLTGDEAHALAALLIECADEVERWVTP